MNEHLIKIFLTIEALDVEQLKKVQTWVEYILQKKTSSK